MCAFSAGLAGAADTSAGDNVTWHWSW